MIPGGDHLRTWTKDGHRVVTSEPYRLSESDLDALAGFCRAHGLNADVSAESWWCPGLALRVTFTRREEPRR